MSDENANPEGQGNEGAPPSTVEDIRLPKSKFDDRLEQAKRAGVTEALKAIGFESVEAAQQFRTNAEQTQAAVDEARRAEMSELEQTKADLEAERAAKAELAAEKEQAELEAQQAQVRGQIVTACAQRGVKNTGFATYLIEEKLMKMGDDDVLDEGEFLDDLLKDDNMKAALVGTAGAPVEIPATTSTTDGPPPKANQDNGEFDAMKASPEEMQAYLDAIDSH
jgi:hypothetical protein